MKRIELHDEVVVDIAEIAERYPYELFEGPLDKLLTLISEQPFLPQRVGDMLPERYRRAVLQRIGYVIVYEVLDESCFVISIHDGRRAPGLWMRRL